MEERDFFEEKSEQRKHTLTCPHCGKAEEYDLIAYSLCIGKRLNSRIKERVISRKNEFDSMFLLAARLCKLLRRSRLIDPPPEFEARGFLHVRHLKS